MAKYFGNGFDGNPKRYFGNISRGYSQKPLVTSTTQNAPLGAILEYQDGTQFRYALAAAAIDTANLCASDVLTAANAGPGLVATDNSLTAAAVGATEVVLTSATVASGAANVFAGASLMIEDDAGEGHRYPIIASTAGSPTTLTIHKRLPRFFIHLAVTDTFWHIYHPYIYNALQSANVAVFVVPPRFSLHFKSPDVESIQMTPSPLAGSAGAALEASLTTP